MYNAKKISFIIPVLNEAASLNILASKTIEAMKTLDYEYEIIFIDDGSNDDSYKTMNELRHENKKIKIIQFRRNFGKSAALSAGFSHASGNLIITMDADLQDDPAEIPNFINKINKGFDLVSGWKKNRQDPWLKKISSKIFNRTVGLFTGTNLHDINCGFKIMRPEVVKTINIYGELHRFLPILAHQCGFKIAEIPIKHCQRVYGNSKYGKWGLRRIKNYLLDPLNIILLTKYKSKPAHFFGNFGLLIFLIGFIICLYMTYLRFLGEKIGDRPLLLLGILLILVSIQLISVGFLGEIITMQNSKENKNFHIKEKKF